MIDFPNSQNCYCKNYTNQFDEINFQLTANDFEFESYEKFIKKIEMQNNVLDINHY